MPSSANRNRKRRINIVQFVALLTSIAIIGGLLGVLGAGLMIPAVGAAGAAVRAIPETFDELPAELDVIEPSESSKMVDADGRVLARFFTELRTIVDSDQIAPVMKNAIVAIEDWRFESHHGIDPDGMVRAVFNNLVVGGGTQGASTITQQYVKNILVNEGIQAGDQDLIDSAQEQSIVRKLREARYAVALESKLTKDEILTGYLNLATFGANIYGVEAASRAYFSKSANDLTVAEAALLAGTVKSPVEYDPLISPEASQERRDQVLYEMEHRGYISEEERDAAVATPIEEMLNPENLTSGCSGAGDAAYFCEYAVADFLADEAFGADRAARQRLLNTGGLTIHTTLRQKNQDAAYGAVVGGVPVDDSSGLDTALVSLDPKNGYIVAMAQNTRFGIATESDPRATTLSYTVDTAHGGGTGFQPGSIFKMFTLVQWFTEGRSAYEQVGRTNRIFTNGMFKCGGQPFPTPDPWTANDLANKDGLFDLIKATNYSVNQAFGDMATKVDFCAIFEKSNAMGVVDGITGETVAMYPPGIIGGASTVTPMSMAVAYGTLANDGVKCNPMSITQVEGADGEVIKTNSPNCVPAIDANVARQVSTVLTKSASTYPNQIDRPMAAKSGTTDLNDNTWLVGFTPSLVAITWTGHANASATPIGDITINGQYYPVVYGETISAPIWAQYMRSALEGTEIEAMPDVFIGNVPTVKTPTTTANGQTTTSGNSSSGNSSSGNSTTQQTPPSTEEKTD
ncbi:MAG: transglycosylase domain-containing protein [Scrofimicrobium sp.]